MIHSFVVVKDLFFNFLIGADFLRKSSAVLNYSNNTVTFYDGLITIPLQCFNSIKNCACIHRTICIPAFSEIIAPVRLPKNYHGTEAILEHLQNNLTPVLVGGCITSVQHGIGTIRLLNFKPHPVTLKRSLLVASIIFSDNVSSITPVKNNDERKTQKKFMNSKKPSTETLKKFVAEYKFSLYLELTTAERYELMNVLYQNRDVFARDISEIKTYKDFELELKPRSWDIKSYTRQYRLPEHEAEEAHKQIKQIKKQGLVKENEDCTYNSAVFMVKKKSNALRMVCDLRKINRLLKPFVIQLPKIDQILDDITAQSFQMLTSIDPYKGYYSICLSPKTNQLTVFCSLKIGQNIV